MNCCDDYGQCKQGFGCPCREAVETDADINREFISAACWVAGWFIAIFSLFFWVIL